MAISPKTIYDKLTELAEIKAGFDGTLESEASCDAAINALDKAVDIFANLRLEISYNKAALANQWIRDNLMTNDESAAIVSELASNQFFDLPPDSCFFAWLKKFYSKFLAGSGCHVNLVNATTNSVDASSFSGASRPRKDLFLWLAHDSDPRCSAVVAVPLPGSIWPEHDSQTVLGGINVYVADVDVRIGSCISYNSELVLANECNLELVKTALQKTVCIGKTDELADLSERRMWMRMDKAWWWTATSSFQQKHELEYYNYF